MALLRNLAGMEGVTEERRDCSRWIRRGLAETEGVTIDHAAML